MMIWMKHEDHGVLPVYDEGEAQRNEKSGWIRFTPDWLKSEPVEEPVIAVEEPAKRRGRKPKGQ